MSLYGAPSVMKLSYPGRTFTGNAEFKGNVDHGVIEKRGLSVLRESSF